MFKTLNERVEYTKKELVCETAALASLQSQMEKSKKKIERLKKDIQEANLQSSKPRRVETSEETKLWIKLYNTTQGILESCRINSEAYSSSPYWYFAFSALTTDTSVEDLFLEHFEGYRFDDGDEFSNTLRKCNEVYDKAKQMKE